MQKMHATSFYMFFYGWVSERESGDGLPVLNRTSNAISSLNFEARATIQKVLYLLDLCAQSHEPMLLNLFYLGRH